MPPQPDTWNPINLANIAEYNSAGTNKEQYDKLGLIEANTWIFHAPVIVYIKIPKNSTMYQAYDAGAFGYGISLSAHEHGLVIIPAYEFVRYPQEIHDVIDIPENESLIMGIGIGYAKDCELNDFYQINGRASLDSIFSIK